MNSSQQLAQHLRQVHTGGNWTSVNLKDTLAGITVDQANTKVESFHTIAELVFHINYYISEVLKVLKGSPLTAHDQFSFNISPPETEEEWQKLLQKVFTDAELFAQEVEKLPESTLTEPFTNEKYGTYYRNMLGIIEHTHYHLGQIALLKKMIRF